MALTSNQRKQIESTCQTMVAKRRRNLIAETASGLGLTWLGFALGGHYVLNYPWSAVVACAAMFTAGTIYGMTVGWQRGSRGIPVTLSQEPSEQG
jgi:hypothetical protein